MNCNERFHMIFGHNILVVVIVVIQSVPVQIDTLTAVIVTVSGLILTTQVVTHAQ